MMVIVDGSIIWGFAGSLDVNYDKKVDKVSDKIEDVVFVLVLLSVLQSTEFVVDQDIACLFCRKGRELVDWIEQGRRVRGILRNE